MRKKLRCIMLVDDNPDDNFIHERVIRKTECAEEVLTMESAIDAIDFLRAKKDQPDGAPELVIIDINMPMMNGWEFLEEYGQLGEETKKRTKVVMLSTSNNPDDMQKAAAILHLSSFRIKPLSPLMIAEIIQDHFPEYL